jgi:hypothetical protein
LFNQDAGRFDSITLHQITKMDITVAGQTMQQQIDQVIDVKVSPADADATAESAAATESSE